MNAVDRLKAQQINEYFKREGIDAHVDENTGDISFKNGLVDEHAIEIYAHGFEFGTLDNWIPRK